ncbi:MAG: hypothetical protein H7A46_06025 [Verrucomicrobiales bacterium]|nr:hypothetical protein [Verrucomicrobiales bacterium]
MKLQAQSQRGVALVITLVMLSVVTLMAITFLAVSRRERKAVEVAGYQTTAKLQADSALARAQADLVSRMMGHGSLLDYGLEVSTNLWAPYGFDPALPLNLPNFTNVNYQFPQGNPFGILTEDQRLRAMGNLMFSARAPVYVSTNSDSSLPLDFRFYLDLNRNGRFDTNGAQAVLNALGQPTLLPGGEVLSNVYVGDPEWIGMLEYPDAPHSGTNRFIGRLAYLIQPAGKSLDFNYVHNNAGRQSLNGLGYYRNEGVGPWELNFAAFLRDLNTNVWVQYDYRGLSSPATTDSGLDAFGFLEHRYANNYATLFSVNQLFGAGAATVFRNDHVDAYTDGPHFGGVLPLDTDNDQTTVPWPGSDSPVHYFQINDLFDPNQVPANWLNRLLAVQTGLASYDRHTFYRLLGGIGMDSAETGRRKLNINYKNTFDPATQRQLGPTNLVDWQPLDFFLTAADRMLEASRVPGSVPGPDGLPADIYVIGDTVVRTNFSATNIMLYPRNEYTPTVHRLLQLAVNIYDATTNRTELSDSPYLPTVLKPRFGVEGTNIFIVGYSEVTNTTFLNSFVLRDLNLPADRAVLASEPDGVAYDVPFLIGAKKGFPNFNEYAMLNVAQVSRRAEVVKRSLADVAPSQTNLSYLVTVSNRFGVEFWNSYSDAFPAGRNLHLRLAGDVRMMMTNSEVAAGALWANRYPFSYDTTVTPWAGKEFKVPVVRDTIFLPEAAYVPLPRPQLLPGGENTLFQRGLGFYVPQLELLVSNRFFAALIDESSDRLVDFVAFSSMNTRMNLAAGLSGQPQGPGAIGVGGEPGGIWLTNRIQNSTSLLAPTLGVVNQMDISLGNTPISDQQWRSYSRTGPAANDKDRAIDVFREFCGFTPLVYQTPLRRSQIQAEAAGRIAMQAPFTPTRKMYQEVSWQANDPLVHYLAGDLLDPRGRPNDPNRTNSIRFAVPPSVQVTNANLGLLNQRYRPWGGNPNQSYDVLASDPGAKDPGVYGSDDWQFPTNKLPNVGWLGRVHRGTPWQTVYLKSAVTDTNRWYQYAGSLGTHPTNDWKLLQIFTTALNDNASRGLLSVNQPGIAAWSAVLSGVSVLTNTTPAMGYRTNDAATYEELFIEPNTPQLQAIVAGLANARAMEQAAGVYPIPAFGYLGRVLATPELTLASPYISTNHLMSDAIVERIPQQVLGLLKEDEPRFVVYAFGQSLREADGSVYIGPGSFNRMCTNYTVTGEYVSKSVIRIDGPVHSPRAVVESYNEIYSD